MFKARLKDFFKCARSEAGKLVAMEIVKHIGPGLNIDIYRKLFEKLDSVLNTRVYPSPEGASRTQRPAKNMQERYQESLIRCVQVLSSWHLSRSVVIYMSIV